MASKRQNAKRDFDEQTMLREVFKEYTLLTAQEERALLMRKDDMDAREKLVCHNCRLVWSIVEGYQYVSDFSFGDLFQLGVEGLMYAINHFDLARDVKLSTYATKCIHGYVVRCIQKNSSIHISEKMMANIYDMVMCERNLTKQLGYVPKPEEISKKLNISLEELEKRRVIQGYIKPMSLSHGFCDDDDKTLEDTIEDNTDLDKNLVMQDLHAALDSLDPREKMIIRLYYGLDMEKGQSLTKIAKQMEISKQRVQQIKDKAMNKLILFFNDQNS